MLFGSRLAPAIGVVEASKIVLCGVAFTLFLGVLRVPPYTRILGGLLLLLHGLTTHYSVVEDALFGLAQAHEKLGDHARAVELWRRYVAEAPDSPWKLKARERIRVLSASPMD